MCVCKFTLWWRTHSLCAAVAGVQMECPSEALSSIKRLGDDGREGGWDAWKDEKGNGVDGEGK